MTGFSPQLALIFCAEVHVSTFLITNQAILALSLTGPLCNGFKREKIPNNDYIHNSNITFYNLWVMDIFIYPSKIVPSLFLVI